MKNLLLYTLFLILAACSATKQQAMPESTIPDNPLDAICAVRNSQGLTIDDYLAQEGADEADLIENFFQDQIYLSSIVDLGQQLQATIGEVPEAEVDRFMQAAMVDYPGCVSAFPMMVMVAGNSVREE